MPSVIDSILNKFTMYKVVLYGLCALLLVSYVLSGLGLIGVQLGGLVVSTLVLGIVCYVSNEVFARIMKVPTGSESYLITALILTCILLPGTSLHVILYSALAGVIAMASKYLLVYKGSHIFNPAAFGAFIVSVTGLAPVIWWIATPWMAPFAALLALLVLRKQQHFKMFGVFVATALLMMTLVSMEQHTGASIYSVIKGGFLSWPIIFFGSIMLTEPHTLPKTNYFQLMVAAIAGLFFSSQLAYHQFGTTPQAVLVFVNLLVVILMPNFGAMLKIKKVQKLSPNIYEVVFEKPKNFVFSAGQYMQLTLPHRKADIRGNRRMFSIVSAPHETDLRVAFRHFDKSSSFKSALVYAEPGSVVRMGHVDGDFMLPHENQPVLLIAGGIGVTPFHSMIMGLKSKGDIVLLYLSNSESDFVFKEDFKQAEKLGVKTIYLTDILTDDKLKSLVQDYDKRLVYISGPDGMVRGYKKLLKSMGVSSGKIKTDYFSGY